MNDHDQPSELTEAERRAFADLPRAAEPPVGLEERVVVGLRRRGHLGLRPMPLLARLAAALLLLATGLIAGRLSVDTTPGQGGAPRFMLLLYEPPGWSESQEGDLVAEYSGWAHALRGEGREVTGSPLGETARLVGGGVPGDAAVDPSSDLALSGYFILGAEDLDAAEQVAKSCPHLAHGGTIVVRPLGG